MGGKNGLEAVEKTLIDRAVISAVSYTHLTGGQQVGADKVRRTVAGAFLVAAADVTVLLDRKSVV